MEERDFYDENTTVKPANLNCVHCHQTNSYDIRWITRTRKKALPPNADEQDRAKFAKAQSHMVRLDDLVQCKNVRCRKRFEISGLQSVVLI